ncbi:class I SAM-dependent methyltransferase [Trinickia sp. NRRL B-1857]|uniref:class I SAM-dependent methyltransferase n=1 Tax=Trinickia sp. NRRL B-1857 TaxID=3162879 RepID=UPI003D2A00E9
MTLAQTHQQEIESGERFSFGENWSRFLMLLDEERVKQAERSLCQMLGVDSLVGKTFLDIGSGSGLFSLAARRLGAKVFSFDYDPKSVACGLELRRRYFDGDADWTIQEGSVLDEQYLERLGKFDVVYSWGVLHHTGKMWDALENAAALVADGGKLFIALYNDQGVQSRVWWWIKKAYVTLPPGLRWVVVIPCYIPLRAPMFIKGLLRGNPFKPFRTYKSLRGMSLNRDLVDWVGGFPFEVAKPIDVTRFYEQRGFVSTKTVTVGAKLGCNEFVFRRKT